jgi:hypothetical protein
MKHNYLAGLAGFLGGMDKNFLQCGQLVRQISVSSLKRPKDLGALGDIAQLVERDVVVNRPAVENRLNLVSS